MQNKKYVIVTHKLYHGVSQDMYKYLKKKKIKTLLIEHDISNAKNRITHYSYFNGKKEIKNDTFNWNFLPDTVCYVKDFIYTFLSLLFNWKKFDVYVGAGGFNVLAGIFLKKLRKVKKVIFYTIDYIPKRFSNNFLNKIYHKIDKYCVKNSDETWNLSPRMVKARKQFNDMSFKKYNKQKWVPVGVWLDELPKNLKRVKNRKQLIFVGHILEKQGLQLVLKAIPSIIKKIPNFNFVVIGGGPYLETLKQMASDLDINNFVEFKGPIYDHKKVNHYLGKSHLSIAMYDKKLDYFTYYADPTKLKTYLAMGLPILLTDVSYNARDIEKAGCGKIVKYDPKTLSLTIIELLKDERIIKKYSNNAKEYIKSYNWNKIFRENLGV